MEIVEQRTQRSGTGRSILLGRLWCRTCDWQWCLAKEGKANKNTEKTDSEEINSVLSRSKISYVVEYFFRNYFLRINYLLTTIAVPDLRPGRNLLHRLFLARIIYHYYRETASNFIQLKACSHITFESTSAFQEHVKFLSTSRKPNNTTCCHRIHSWKRKRRRYMWM